MKRSGLILIVLIITGIAIIFLNNSKSYKQGQNQSLTNNVYNFLENTLNRKDIYGKAIELNQGNSSNACVYFISEVLRRNNFNVPKKQVIYRRLYH